MYELIILFNLRWLSWIQQARSEQKRNETTSLVHTLKYQQNPWQIISILKCSPVSSKTTATVVLRCVQFRCSHIKICARTRTHYVFSRSLAERSSSNNNNKSWSGEGKKIIILLYCMHFNHLQCDFFLFPRQFHSSQDGVCFFALNTHILFCSRRFFHSYSLSFYCGYCWCIL